MAPEKKKGSSSGNNNNPPQSPPNDINEPEEYVTSNVPASKPLKWTGLGFSTSASTSPSSSPKNSDDANQPEEYSTSNVPATKIPKWTGTGFATSPSSSTSASASNPSSPTALVGLGIGLGPIPSFSETPATPTLGPTFGEGGEEKEKKKTDVKGSRLSVPRYGHPDYDPIKPKPLNISNPAASVSAAPTPAPAPAPASEAPSTPDLNEYAIASSSEDDSPPPVFIGKRGNVNMPSLLPAPLFGPVPSLGSKIVASESKPPAEEESPPRIINEIQVNTPGAKVAPLFSGPPPALPGDGAVSESEAESKAPIETEVTPPRIINGRQVNTPGAQVAPLFSGPPPALPGSEDGVSESEMESGRPAESETESKAPTETFSEAGELEAVSLATTPEPSPLRSLRAFRPIEAEAGSPAATTTTTGAGPTSVPTRTADPIADASTSSTPPPVTPNPYFNATNGQDGTSLFPEPTDPRDRAATMSMDGSAPEDLRSHRADRINIENRLFQAENARLNPPPNPDVMVAAFRPREISDFLRYAEDHPNDESVKIAKKALEAAMRKEREQMISHLELANANRELDERMTMLDQDLARAMKDASRQRKVGQYSQEDLEKAVLVKRNLKRGVEDELKQAKKEAFRVEMADELLRQEAAKVKDLEEKVRRHRDDIHDLQTKVELKDEQIRTLLSEKGNLISREECAEFNARTYRDFQDNISGLEAQLEAEKTKATDLEGALETAKGKTTEALSGSNGSDEHGLLTEEQCNERWEANKELLSRDKEALLNQVNDAEDALRRCRQASSENSQREGAYSDQPLHEQIFELYDLLERNSILIDTQQQLLMDKGALGGGPVTLEDVQTEYSKLRTEIQAKNNGLAAQLGYVQRARTANQELNGIIQKLHATLKEKAPRRRAPALTGTDAERIIALDKERADLQDSQAVLRQTNDILRAELETIKEKFTETKEDRDALKEALRNQAGRSGGLGPKNHIENPELIRCLERNTEYERERSSLKKEIEGYEASAATADGEIAVLQQVIHDKDAKIAFIKDSREKTKNELEAKIVALEEAKADREQQIQRYTRKIAELKNLDQGK
jgi:hypothetical protein